MDNYDIIISDLAKRDIRSISSYIKYDLHEPAIAKTLIDTIIDGIFSLSDMPSRINLVNDEHLAEKQIRGLQIKNYTVFFRINKYDKIIEIIRVLYSRRDWQSLL